jgi:hypothetical protein
MKDVILKRFETPDEVRKFEKGHVPPVSRGNCVVGETSYVSLHFVGAESYAR